MLPSQTGYRCKKVSVTLFAVFFVFVLNEATGAFGQNLPNIIFIVTDDQGVDAIQGANWPNDILCHTPVIAALASQGRVFENTRVNPLCSPSRATLMTGRSALRTGVTNVIDIGKVAAPLLALQNHERTIAEVLHDLGYYTLLMDKWHLSAATDQEPEAQGFDVYRNKQKYMHLDDPIAVGDEHISLMVDFAINDVLKRPDPTAPYALMFWSIDPHRRTDKTGRERLNWWKVDQALLPSGEPYYHQNPQDDTQRDRYRAVVEASDTEYGRMLQEIGVIDTQLRYIPSSNTIVFFIGDNGTPTQIKVDSSQGKGSLLDGGILVPFFVFGEKVPSDGAILSRLISGQDMYDTIADIVNASPGQRNGEKLPRQSYSFADDIGWAQGTLPQREYTVSSRPADDTTGPSIAMTGQQYKLICDASSKGLDHTGNDIFYDLFNDPGEVNNLLNRAMSRRQKAAYLHMRDAVVDYWNTSVSTPLKDVVDIPITAVGSLNSLDQQLVPPTIGYINPNAGDEVEARIFITFDINSIDDQLPIGRTLADVDSAQIILFLSSDSPAADETATAPLKAFAMNTNWHSKSNKWADIYDQHSTTLLGTVDLMPHIIQYAGGKGTLPPGTPISMGHNASLLQMINDWHDGVTANNGIVILTDPMPNLGGNQQIRFFQNAGLRLHLK